MSVRPSVVDFHGLHSPDEDVTPPPPPPGNPQPSQEIQMSRITAGRVTEIVVDTDDLEGKYDFDTSDPMDPNQTLASVPLETLANNEGRVRTHSYYHAPLTKLDLQGMANNESLDYHIIHNDAYKEEQWKKTSRDYRMDGLHRWLLSFYIGVVTGCVAFFVHYCVENITEQKFDLVQKYVEQNAKGTAWIAFVGLNLLIVLPGTLLVVYWVPAASSSGIPDMKGYLNGSRIPKAVNIKTFVVKLIGVISAVASSCFVGPEGPMIHLGGIIGGSASQPRSKTFGCSVPFMAKFASDKDRRDFISTGTACGVSAAFGAPIGGILFSIEEASSHWSQTLTWRTFFACMVATFTANIFFTGQIGRWGQFDVQSLIVFNAGTQSTYHIWELIPFALMGVIGGVFGALFTIFNVKLNQFRTTYLSHRRWLRVFEVVMIVIVTSSLCFGLPYAYNCKEKVPVTVNDLVSVAEGIYSTVTFNCANPDIGVHTGNITEQYNPMGTLLFTSQTGAFKTLVSRGTYGQFPASSLIVFCIVYFIIAAYTAGSAMASGLMVPFLLIGASYGRLIGHLMNNASGSLTTVDPGVYALIGAASFFGGGTRMTISLSIIMLEISNDLQFLPPIMLTVMVSKWIGDLLTHPLYDMIIVQRHIPFLESEPPNEMDKMECREIMATNVKCLPEITTVKAIVRLLSSCTHNGFPVITLGAELRSVSVSHATSEHMSLSRSRRLRIMSGLILRKQLVVIIQQRLFLKKGPWSTNQWREWLHFADRATLIDVSATLSNADLESTVDLTPYMNRSTFVVNERFLATFAFKLFRSMGLRHLPVVSNENDVVGMLTRKDLLDSVVEAQFERVIEKRKTE